MGDVMDIICNNIYTYQSNEYVDLKSQNNRADRQLDNPGDRQLGNGTDHQPDQEDNQAVPRSYHPADHQLVGRILGGDTVAFGTIIKNTEGWWRRSPSG